MRATVLLDDQPPALPIDLGTIKWVKGNQSGIEFVRLPLEAQQRLNRMLRTELIRWLETGKTAHSAEHPPRIYEVLVSYILCLVPPEASCVSCD